jgi:hypothetical protein
MLGVGVVPLPRRAVVDRLFVGADRRALWNPSWERTRVIDAWSRGHRNYQLFHEEIRGALGGLVSGRDFVQARVSWHDDDDGGRSWVVYCSVLDGRAPAPSSGHARGFALPSGSMAKEIAGEPGHSLVHSLVHTSPGGTIPAWIVAKGVSAELSSFFSLVSSVFKSK